MGERAFDHRQMARLPLAPELHDRLAPVTLAREHLLAVPEPLRDLFPSGGMQRGWSVGFEGPGGWSIALAMAASVASGDAWMAVVGVEELGLVAAAELGVRLDRLLVIESSAPNLLATVTASLVEVADVVALAPRQPVSHRDARRLTARARERGSVLFHLDGGRGWPLALDVTITATTERWEGIGQGHGHLRSRRLGIEAVGRRSAARRRHLSVLLPGPDGGVVAAPGSRRVAGDDAPAPLLAEVS
jgi:hypothetical protein